MIWETMDEEWPGRETVDEALGETVDEAVSKTADEELGETVDGTIEGTWEESMGATRDEENENAAIPNSRGGRKCLSALWSGPSRESLAVPRPGPDSR